MAFSAALFSSTTKKIAQILADRGFSASSEVDSSGAHHAIFFHGATRFKLTWNEKDAWICITRREHEHVSEEEIFFRSVKNANDKECAQSALAAVSTLHDQVSRTHEHEDDDHGCCSCSHHHA